MRFLVLLLAVLTACAPPSLALAYSPVPHTPTPAAACVELPGAVEIGDLNGDGKPEVVVSYTETLPFPGSPTFSYLMVAEVDGDCMRPVYVNEQGHDSTFIEAHAKAGWDGLVLTFDAGDMTLKVLAAHDGKSYRWSELLSCSGTEQECKAAFKSFAP